MKTCTRCGNPGIFYKDRTKKDGLHSICVACHKQYKHDLYARDSPARDRALARSKQYRFLNPEKVKTGIVNATLRKKYGITLEQYNNMLQQQDNACAVCKETPVKQRLHVDHNHTTGKVRGLLCQACNTSIGKLKENPELIRALALYVESRK